MTFLQEFAAYQGQHGEPDRIELLLCDINAIFRGKWLKGSDAAKLEKGQVRLPISTYVPNIIGEELPETGIGSSAGDPDGILTAIPGSLRPAPWFAGHVAQVQVEMRSPNAEFDGLSTRQLRGLALDHAGLGPKRLARVRRLDGALPQLATDPDLARVALRHGWYDHAHLSNDFRALTGASPTQWRTGRGMPTVSVGWGYRP